ncbi:unnamed protein product, partial [Sphenostylis stenocarpa]
MVIDALNGPASQKLLISPKETTHKGYACTITVENDLLRTTILEDSRSTVFSRSHPRDWILKMVSDASKKKAAQKKAAAAAKRGGKAVAASSKMTSSEKAADNLANGIGEIQISDRTCTGVLCSHPLSRDIRVSTVLLIH